MQEGFLSLTVFIAAVGALILVVIPNDEKMLIRRFAFFWSFIPLGMVLTMWFQFDRLNPGLQFIDQAEWFPSIGASYFMAADGISLSLMLLATILTPLSILASFGIEDEVKNYMVLMLLMETAMLGLFTAQDLLIFFIFWEIGLVPIYLLIRIWGGKDRVYASFKFFIYTMAGSLGMLLSIQIIGISSGTFNIPELLDVWVNLR